MKTLISKNIKLRALEPEDLEFLYSIENNESFWEVSHTKTPFSKFILKQYISNTALGIYQLKQIRFIIEEIKTKTSVGLIDLFDFNAYHNRAGIGIIVSKVYQGKGYANEALKLLINYCFLHLNLHQLYANILTDNKKSLTLFKKNNFIKIGIKKDWILSKGKYKNEVLFQLINE